MGNIRTFIAFLHEYLEISAIFADEERGRGAIISKYTTNKYFIGDQIDQINRIFTTKSNWNKLN